MAEPDEPLPQDEMEGVDDDEWVSSSLFCVLCSSSKVVHAVLPKYGHYMTIVFSAVAPAIFTGKVHPQFVLLSL